IAGESDLELTWASSGAKAISEVQKNPRGFSVIVMDYLMPDMSGAETTQRLLEINPDLLIAMYSGDQTRDAIKVSHAAGAVEFLDKGISSYKLIQNLKSFCKKFEDTYQILATEDSPNACEDVIKSVGMIGRSPKLAEIARTIKSAAGSDCNVVIFGETGTGKELVARALHNLSTRKNRPFIPINVATLSPELFESDLFGHVKGSFTGAVGDKVGKFKLANGGTIFLDEIAELKLDLQARLLRVLQDGDFYPVGSNKSEKVDVRVIAASNIELEKAVKNGKFREDLYYRLNVLKIKTYPLRERIEDIRPLVQFFQRKYRGSEKVILMKSIKMMELYKWPGNIRELENEVERLMETVTSNKIEPVHLDAKFFLEENQVSGSPQIRDYSELNIFVRNLERDLISVGIKKAQNNLKLAAEVLGIGYSTLRSKVKDYNINVMEG
ncbi:MAG: sigma-54-dependent Fis family transcriptional regulator, partial [Bdellovibrionaceae bacterium]|nr:sigma-54-dependent Fis family transcriptional regulator [Pseudobdellovibrionaceae bacterium]